jgi:hypothetical protein
MELRIDERFCGPPATANGGYLGGRLAALVGGVAEVTFRRATPLGRAVRVERVASGVDLYDGDALCASARAGSVDLEAPEPVSIEVARAAARAFPRWVDHPIPRCYVCGPERPPGDGLCIFPGPVPGREMVYAAPWTPDASVADASGVVLDEHHWGALDCTGAFAVNEPPRGVALLGKLAAKILRRVNVGEEVIVAGWPIALDGRKLHAGTAIYSAPGELYAIARALWILT